MSLVQLASAGALAAYRIKAMPLEEIKRAAESGITFQEKTRLLSTSYLYLQHLPITPLLYAFVPTAESVRWQSGFLLFGFALFWSLCQGCRCRGVLHRSPEGVREGGRRAAVRSVGCAGAGKAHQRQLQPKKELRGSTSDSDKCVHCTLIPTCPIILHPRPGQHLPVTVDIRLIAREGEKTP